jgi:hypothetical protein
LRRCQRDAGGAFLLFQVIFHEIPFDQATKEGHEPAQGQVLKALQSLFVLQAHDMQAVRLPEVTQMTFKSDRQRKAVMSKLSTWQRIKRIPTEYERYKHKQEAAHEKAVEKEIEQTQRQTEKEVELAQKRLELERKLATLRKQKAELAQLKHERFEASTLGKAWSGLKHGAEKTVEYAQRATDQAERGTRRKSKRKDDDDGEILFGVD